MPLDSEGGSGPPLGAWGSPPGLDRSGAQPLPHCPNGPSHHKPSVATTPRKAWQLPAAASARGIGHANSSCPPNGSPPVAAAARPPRGGGPPALRMALMVGHVELGGPDEPSLLKHDPDEVFKDAKGADDVASNGAIHKLIGEALESIPAEKLPRGLLPQAMKAWFEQDIWSGLQHCTVASIDAPKDWHGTLEEFAKEVSKALGDLDVEVFTDGPVKMQLRGGAKSCVHWNDLNPKNPHQRNQLILFLDLMEAVLKRIHALVASVRKKLEPLNAKVDLLLRSASDAHTTIAKYRRLLTKDDKFIAAARLLGATLKSMAGAGGDGVNVMFNKMVIVARGEEMGMRWNENTMVEKRTYTCWMDGASRSIECITEPLVLEKAPEAAGPSTPGGLQSASSSATDLGESSRGSSSELTPAGSSDSSTSVLAPVVQGEPASERLGKAAPAVWKAGERPRPWATPRAQPSRGPQVPTVRPEAPAGRRPYQSTRAGGDSAPAGGEPKNCQRW